jgi:ankyrin repeat protein
MFTNVVHYGKVLALLLAVSLCGCSGPDSVAGDNITVGGTGVEMPFDTAAKAAFDGDLAYVKQCVESDPLYVQGYDGNGRTLLHYAAEGGHADVVKYLLENGALANFEDNDGYYPMDAASRGKGTPEILQLLREAASRESGAVQ